MNFEEIYQQVRRRNAAQLYDKAARLIGARRDFLYLAHGDTPEIREILMDLNVSIEKKNIIKKELAFLEEKKQIEYLEELYIIWNRILRGF